MTIKKKENSNRHKRGREIILELKSRELGLTEDMMELAEMLDDWDDCDIPLAFSLGRDYPDP